MDLLNGQWGYPVRIFVAHCFRCTFELTSINIMFGVCFACSCMHFKLENRPYIVVDEFILTLAFEHFIAL